MTGFPITLRIGCCGLAALLCGVVSAGQPGAAGGVPAEAPAKPKTPASPAELFGAVAKDTRAQWRSLFRNTVPRTAGDRDMAAISLGAICADCYLAAQARDAQQLRNLLTDMSSVEMTLGIARRVNSLRQKLIELADDGDWSGVRREIDSLMASHSAVLAEQRDEALAELEIVGLWLRSIHIAARFSAKLAVPPAQPAIGSPELLAGLLNRVTRLAADRDTRTVQRLREGLESLNRTWAGETIPANAAARLAATTVLLDGLMAALIGDTPPPSGPPTSPP